MNKSPEKFLDSSEKEEAVNSQLYATIGRYIECNEYSSREFRMECSCCSYRQIVKRIAQDIEAYERAAKMGEDELY